MALRSSFAFAGAVIMFFMASCNPLPQNGSSSQQGSVGSSSVAALATNYVQISGMAFNPASITVLTNTLVCWTNKDATSHTVTSTGGQSYDSGTMAQNTGYSVVFANAGTNAYKCSFHPSMTGTVIVTN